MMSSQRCRHATDATGAEVTGDRRYYNSQLTLHPYSTWPDDAEADETDADEADATCP